MQRKYKHDLSPHQCLELIIKEGEMGNSVENIANSNSNARLENCSIQGILKWRFHLPRQRTVHNKSLHINWQNEQASCKGRINGVMHLQYKRCIQKLTKLPVSNIRKTTISYEYSYSSIISLLADWHASWKATRKGNGCTGATTGQNHQDLLEFSKKGNESFLEIR